MGGRGGGGAAGKNESEIERIRALEAELSRIRGDEEDDGGGESRPVVFFVRRRVDRVADDVTDACWRCRRLWLRPARERRGRLRGRVQRGRRLDRLRRVALFETHTQTYILPRTLGASEEGKTGDEQTNEQRIPLLLFFPFPNRLPTCFPPSIASFPALTFAFFVACPFFPLTCRVYSPAPPLYIGSFVNFVHVSRRREDDHDHEIIICYHPWARLCDMRGSHGKASECDFPSERLIELRVGVARDDRSCVSR